MKNSDTIKIFQALNNEARFVGGCVRNFLLDIEIADIDIATKYKPEETIRLLDAAGIKVVPTGLKYGTVTAVLDGQGFEITTLRRDVACDGRHAEVEFTDDWQEDAARRDFTINAMSCDIDGKIYDYFDGQADLAQGLVRFVGVAENRVREDYLRILRFFRFNAYYGRGDMDNESLQACARLAAGIKELSGERIQTEMLKLLAAPQPQAILQIMADQGVLQFIMLFKANLKALERLNIDGVNNVALLRLAAMLCSNASRDDVEQLVAMWKLSNKDRKFLTNILFAEFDFSEQMSLAEQRKAIRKAGKDIFASIVRLNCTDDEVREQMLEQCEQWQVPTFPVGGKDLQAMGIASGKHMGDQLKAAKDWWEEQGYEPGKDEVLEYIKNLELRI